MYRRMSAMMLQLRLRARLPRKMKRKQAMMLMLTKRRPSERNTAEMRSPPAQMMGSARGYFAFNDVDSVIPSGTPTMPDIIMITPKMKETFLVSIPLSSSAKVYSPSVMYLGPHQDRAPVTKVTQVKASVENTKLLFLAKLMISS